MLCGRVGIYGINLRLYLVNFDSPHSHTMTDPAGYVCGTKLSHHASMSLCDMMLYALLSNQHSSPTTIIMTAIMKF